MTEIRLELFSDRPRTGLQRKKQLQPGKPPQRKTYMSRTAPSKKATSKRKAAKLLYCDSFGVAFGDAPKWMVLPEDLNGRRLTLQAARPMRDYPDPSVCQFMHQLCGEPAIDVESRDRITFGVCWLCEEQKILTAHHCVSRWDFLGNICMCCIDCHQKVQHAPEHLREVLLAMWKHNKFLSWVHLLRARGSGWPFDSLD